MPEAVLEALELGVVSVWEDVVALVLVLVAVEGHRKANRTCHSYTSCQSHTAFQGCTSSHTDGTAYHTEHVHLLFQKGNQLGTRHQTLHTSLHRLHPCLQRGVEFHLLDKEAVHNDLLEQEPGLEVLVLVAEEVQVLALVKAQEWVPESAGMVVQVHH